MFNSALIDYNSFFLIVANIKNYEISCKNLETFLENPDTLVTVPVFLLGNNQLELVTDKHVHFRLPQSLLLPTVPC